MPSLSCVVAYHPRHLSQVVSRVVPLRDFSRVVHQVAANGAPDNQSRFHFYTLANCTVSPTVLFFGHCTYEDVK